MVTHGLHIVGFPTLTGLLCNSVPITSFTAQRMPQARCSLPSSAVQLHGLKCIVQTVPFGCETPCPREHLMVVMRAALCVYPCFLFLLWALRYLRIKDSEMPRKRLWSTTHLESPGSISHLQHRSPVVAKPGDSHVSHMHSVTCCCSGYFLLSFMPPKSTMVIVPPSSQVRNSKQDSQMTAYDSVSWELKQIPLQRSLLHVWLLNQGEWKAGLSWKHWPKVSAVLNCSLL